jgi:hypothetical protein
LAEFEADFFSSLVGTDVEADEFAVGGGDADLVFVGCELVGFAGESGKDFKADASDDLVDFFGDPECIGGLEVVGDAVKVFVIAFGIPAEVEFLVDGLDEGDDLGLVLGIGESDLGHWSEFSVGLG